MKLQGSSLLVAVLACFQKISASPGNDLYDYQDCRYQCEQISCENNPYNLVQDEIYHELIQNGNVDDYEWHNYNPDWEFTPMPLPWYLNLLKWTCESNCDYQCQQIVTKERIQDNEEILQFHGKWPFNRIYGTQEFISVLFSLGNLIAHYSGFKMIKKSINQNKNTSRSIVNLELYILAIISVITMFAWIFSTIFHIRDFLITERLDYYFAGLTVLSGFYGIGNRVFKLYLPRRVWLRSLFTLACISAYTAHVYRLETDWLYTYNMRANITIGVLQNILWGVSCFKLYNKYYDLERSNEKSQNLTHLQFINPKRIILYSFYSRSPKLYSLYPLLLCVIVIFGMSLEILDFPPIFYSLIDAHSLWHLVTIFPVYYGWYEWMIWDLNENVWDDLQILRQKKDQ